MVGTGKAGQELLAHRGLDLLRDVRVERRHRAAQDDPSGVQHADDVDEPARQAGPPVAGGAQGDAVTAGQRGQQLLQVGRGRRAVGAVARQHRVLADVRLEVAWPVESGAEARSLQRQLPQLPGEAGGPAEQLAPDDEPAAHPVLDVEADHRVGRARGSAVGLADGERVGVVLDQHRHAPSQPFVEQPPQRDVSPAQHEAVHDHARLAPAPGRPRTPRGRAASPRATGEGGDEPGGALDGDGGRPASGGVLHRAAQELAAAQVDRRHRQAIDAQLGPQEHGAGGVELDHHPRSPGPRLATGARRGRLLLLPHQPGGEEVVHDVADAGAVEPQPPGEVGPAHATPPEERVERLHLVQVADRSRGRQGVVSVAAGETPPALTSTL